MRIGHGYDVHRLVPGRDLILGGVKIPYELGLDGHSDADVLLHAVMDALRSAMGASCSAVAVLHDAQLALSRCDRVFVLKDGEIACALDMHTADEAQVSAAMALLSEGTRAVRVDGAWAVLGRGE